MNNGKTSEQRQRHYFGINFKTNSQVCSEVSITDLDEAGYIKTLVEGSFYMKIKVNDLHFYLKFHF